MIIIGHRGACGYTDENTLESIKKALDLKVNCIEIDVHKCKSGELIVHHDITLERTTNSKGFVKNKTYEQIKKIKTKNGFIIPTLPQALNLINRKAKINIEIKSERTYKSVAKIINEFVINKGWDYSDFLVSSFFHNEILKFKKILPNVEIGVLIGHLPHNSSFLDEFKPYCVSVDEEFISKKFIKEVHEKNIKVFAYTVNNVGCLNRLNKMGIDGIFSNFPDQLIK